MMSFFGIFLSNSHFVGLKCGKSWAQNMVQYKNPINLFDSITFDWVTQHKYRGTTKTKFYETSETNVFLITNIRRYLSIIKLCRRDVEVLRKLKDVSSKLRSLFLLVFLLAVTKTGAQFNIPKSNLSQMFSLLFVFLFIQPSYYSWHHFGWCCCLCMYWMWTNKKPNIASLYLAINHMEATERNCENDLLITRMGPVSAARFDWNFFVNPSLCIVIKTSV